MISIYTWYIRTNGQYMRSVINVRRNEHFDRRNMSPETFLNFKSFKHPLDFL